VEFSRREGRYWRGRCPFCKREDALLVDRETLRWSCLPQGTTEGRECRRAGQSPLAFLAGGRLPRAGSGGLADVLKRVALLAGRIPESVPKVSTEDEHQAAQQERAASLLETFFLHAREALLDEQAPVAVAARDFLAQQGFTALGQADIPIGLFADLGQVWQALERTGFTDQEIRASELAADPRLPGMLVVPIRDAFGRIVSFWARSPHEDRPLSLFKGRWKDEVGLFGLNVALRPQPNAAIDGREHLFVVGPILAALFLQSEGITNVAAIGGEAKEITHHRWMALLNVPGHLKRVTFIATGHTGGLLDLVDAAFWTKSSEPELCIALVNPDAVDLAAEVAAKAIHAYRYRAHVLLEKHRKSAWTEPARHKAWIEAVHYYNTAPGYARQALDRQFVPAIVEGLGRTWADFQPLVPPDDAPRKQERPPSRRATSVNGRRRRAIKSQEQCPHHHCKITDCFCFD
jgi:hypothetical protein